jgi:hypothetical protein
MISIPSQHKNENGPWIKLYARPVFINIVKYKKKKKKKKKKTKKRNRRTVENILCINLNF